VAVKGIKKEQRKVKRYSETDKTTHTKLSHMKFHIKA